jgi:pimeloyl-ACP methyl ester carboxylesterase
MADDIAALIQLLKLERPYICGWSDGGHVALETGIRHSEIIGGLIVGGVEIKREVEYYEMLPNMGLLGAGEVDIEKIEENAPEWVDSLKMQHVGDEQWQSLLHQISHLSYAPLEYPVEQLRSLTAPTLIALGDRDQFVPVSHALQLYQSIPHSELAIIPGADHSISRENPLMFSQLIFEFFSRVEKGKGEPEA